MNVNFLQKVNNSFDLAMHCFLFAGSLYFLFYSLSAGKFIYVLLSLAVYFFSFLVRKKLFKVEEKSSFTETGLLLISPLFVAYLLYLLKIDVNIKNYLPDKVLLESGALFSFLIVMYFFSGQKWGFFGFLALGLMVALLIFVSNNQSLFNTFFRNNPWIAETIIGFPFIYLFMTLFGVNALVKKLGFFS